jgi:methionyl aminopeptidase
MVDSQ